MNILVSCDENYLGPLRTMLYSLIVNNEGTDFDIYLIHKDIPEDRLAEMTGFIARISPNSSFNPIKIESLFSTAKVNFYYTEEMYYRLLAFKYLPEDMDKILYLDPDILILNRVDELYNIDLEGKFFAAATHSYIGVKSFNVARLSVSSGYDDIEDYYNSGILMINLKKARESEIYEREVLSYIENSKSIGLMMPDQDLLNVVFRNDIIKISEIKYNYDSRRYLAYRLKDKKYDMNFIMENTVVLHFCGKNKPWNDDINLGTFTSLYLHYQKRAQEA